MCDSRIYFHGKINDVEGSLDFMSEKKNVHIINFLIDSYHFECSKNS